MRDLDPEQILIDTLKAQFPVVPIYAGWPGWVVPPGLEITTNLISIDPDYNQDLTGQGIGVISELWANVWAPDEESARSQATAVVNSLNLREIQPANGAAAWFLVQSVKPQHEPAPEGTIYRFIIDIQLRTHEEV